MGAALALAERGRGLTAPNPNVGCLIVADGRVVGRGWTQPGGRPHAEAMALAQAGEKSRGATVHVTLEPCAHESSRGPACSDLLIAAGVARVVVAIGDPDPRTAGRGVDRLRAAGIEVAIGIGAIAARRSIAGFLTRQAHGRPFVTLKLATSLDGCIAMADGTSRWITGPQARAHVHLERSRHEAILVGRGTVESDAPRLDVRLPGLEEREPRRVMLSSSLSLDAGERAPHADDAIEFPSSSPRTWSGVHRAAKPTASADEAPRPPEQVRGDGVGAWTVIPSPAAIATLDGVDHLFVEGGAKTAAGFLAADLVDRLLLYRAPILIGGRPALGDIGLTDLAAAHDRWAVVDARALGSDRLEVYERRRS